MARLIRLKKVNEGEVFCRWMENRLIRNNKNVLGAELGATGSGKSYRDLRKAELWYQYHFKKPFPPENICFGTAVVMRKLSSGELKKGEILIFEEAGVNLGSLDFQTRVSKLFTYVLQSFRKMNVALFFNLPYLSMLNKSARMLLHYSFESAGIDYQNKINKCKPFFHQVNQATGKIYKKYLRVRVNGKQKTIKKFNFNHPSPQLAQTYEIMKTQYLADMTKEYTDELEKLEEEKLKKLGRPELSDFEKEIYDLACQGKNGVEIAKILNKYTSTVYYALKRLDKNGYSIKKKPKSLENSEFPVELPTPTTT